MTQKIFVRGCLCVALALFQFGCSDDEQAGQVGSETVSTADATADTFTSVDVPSPADVEVADDLVDVATDTAPIDVVDTETSAPPADAGAETDIPADTVADTMVADTIADTMAPADGGPAISVADCPVQPMDIIYAGFLPPNPFAAWPPADSCVAAKHDVIIVLGCPNKDDGQPDACQIERADIAIRMMEAGYGDRFIVSGAAVHTPFVEAETLRDLLVARGVSEEAISLEPQAQHTDENIYFSSQIMLSQSWETAVVVSESPGHLMMSAICDSNCCVDLGRLTVFEFPLAAAGGSQKAGHYVLKPASAPIDQAECDTIEGGLKFMCVNLANRLACDDNFQLPQE